MSATPSPPASHARIRPALDGDVADIAAVYADHVRHGSASFEVEPPSVAEMARRRAGLLESGHPYLVAIGRAGDLLGYAYAGPYRPRAAYRNTVESSIYLRPEAAGRGLGSRLLTALIHACEALSFRQMVAVVGDSANLPSIRLHARHGFRHVGTLETVGFKHGRWVDSVLLQRRLGDGSASAPCLPYG